MFVTACLYSPDFEASFIRLLDKVTNGSRIEINQTGECDNQGGTVILPSVTDRAFFFFLISVYCEILQKINTSEILS